MNKVIKNYIYNLSYQILVILVPLITTPYVSRVLGAKGVGIFSYTNSIVQYFILFGCVGLNLYGQREIAYVQHDVKKRNAVFFELVILRIITVTLSIILFYFTMVQSTKYGYIFLIMMIDIIASMVDISWFFQGIEDFKKTVIRNFCVKLLGVALIFLFVKSSGDLKLYVLCHSMTLFLGNLSLWVYMPKLMSKVKLSELNIVRHIKPTIVLFLPQIATSVYTILDKTMIGYLTGIEEEVAFYEQSQKIVKIILTIVTSLGTVMMPRIANLFNQDDMETIRKYIMNSFDFIIFISFPLCFGLIGISNILVPWFFGAGYDKVVPNMMIISPILIMIAMSNIIGIQYLLPTQRQREYTFSIIAGMCVNFVLNLLLIPKFLSLGAAIATVLAETAVTATQFYFVRKELDIKTIFSSNKRYLIMSTIMLVFVTYLSFTLKSTFTNIVITIGAGGLLYLAMLVITKDKNLRFVLTKCKIIK